MSLSSEPIEASGWFLDEPGAPLREDALLLSPSAGEVVVEVWACGVCHTDLGFADGPVRPKHAYPLILGHEAVGRVVRAGEGARALLDKVVLIPAVLPCGSCSLCKQGRGNACAKQQMPGNDIHGAFASHVLVPAGPLQVLPEGGAVDVRRYSVVADAVSTAFQATRRAGLAAGDLCVVVGAGGVGGFAIQIAKALGARVLALDVDEARLLLVAQHGADACVNTRGKEARAVRAEVNEHARAFEIAPDRIRILECAGVAASQELAFTLLGRAGVMVQVGFTPDRTNVRLSNLMALDATVHGSWGCPPEAYPDVLQLIAKGAVELTPFVEVRPMRELPQVLAQMRAHELRRRVALDPRL